MAADLGNIRLMQVLGVSLAATALFSVIIFELATKGDVSIEMESGHIKTLKGDEYDTVLAIRSTGTDWIGSIQTTFKIETAQLVKIEPISEGRVRLRFLGKYAGRIEGVTVGILRKDPLSLMCSLEEVRHADFILDTLPLSLLTMDSPRRLTVYGLGEQPTGYPGSGQELYGLDEYQSSMDTRDIIWKRAAKSPDGRLTARVREASVRSVIRIGVVQFVGRGAARSAWVDMLCEALGQVGRTVFEMGASVTIQFASPGGDGSREVDRVMGVTQMTARETGELAEAVMACSVAPDSRDAARVWDDCDLVITGLKEFEDGGLATLVSGKPVLLISEDAPLPRGFGQRSGQMVYSGKENLFPLIRRVLER